MKYLNISFEIALYLNLLLNATSEFWYVSYEEEGFQKEMSI